MSGCVDLISAVRSHGQGHIFNFWTELTEDDKNILLTNLKVFDFQMINDVFQVNYCYIVLHILKIVVFFYFF